MRNNKIIFSFIVLLLSVSSIYAQRGKITTDPLINNTRIVNEYTAVTADIVAGSTTIQVTNSLLNANNRFSGNLAPGDLIMVIQMQGATLNLTPDPGNSNLSMPKDSTWGTIVSYGNAGKYEFAQVASVPNANTIVVDCGLQNDYTASGKVQVIRIPRYANLTITSSGTVTCDAWNGNTGGVVAIEVLGTTNIAGRIDVNGRGFRGGGRHQVNCLDHELEVWGMSAYMDVGMQGEGIAGDSLTYVTFGAKYGRGAPANGGGGGSNKSCGGGGGANAGDPSLYTGNGNPDISNANYITAWNLEYNGFASSTSSGGGRGGYGAATNNANPLSDPPGTNAWGAVPFRRVNKGGRGGRPLDYSTGRIFLGGGGGGGCGDRARSNADARTAGANGGGLVYLLTYGPINGSGQITANGNAVTQTVRDDGAGGGGAGGTILINTTSTISPTLVVQANGGKGGDQVVPKSLGIPAIESEGPGGGGGGGYISISGGSVTASVLGGANGTTDARPMPVFPANGATRGGAGIYNNTLPNLPSITSGNITVCWGETATLSASLSNNAPSGSVITWYDAPIGGNQLGTGNTYTVSNVTSQQVVYVGFCPGIYRIADTIKVVNPIPVNAGPDTSYCQGESVQLTASGSVSYSWTPATGLSATNISNPIASPAANTSYTVFGTDVNGCVASDIVAVSVKSKPNVLITANPTTVCQGQTVSLQAGGAVAYTWSTTGNPNFSNDATVSVSPSLGDIYTLIGVASNGCSDTQTQSITVNPAPPIAIQNSRPILLCPGDSVLLSASGGVSYSWSPANDLSSVSGSSVYAAPSSSTLYTVTGSDGSCTKTDTVSVFVKSITPVVFSPAAPSICPGQTATINVSGGTNYTWVSPSGQNLGFGNTLNVSPLTDSTYTLLYLSNGCSLTAQVTVTVGSSVDVQAIASTDTVCLGDTVTLIALNGGNFTWSPHPTLNSNIGSPVVAVPSVSTTYTVTGGTGTCVDTGMVTVVVVNNVVNVNPSSATICKGSSVNLTASGADTYSWSNGMQGSSINVSPVSNTSYTVIGSSGGLCPAVGVVSVFIDTAKIEINGPSAVCQGQTAALTALNGSNFSWSTGQTGASINPTINLPSIYTVYGNNINNCSDTATISINPVSQPNLSYTGNTQICNGDNATITWNGANTYSWQGSAGFTVNNVMNVSPAQTTTYTVYGDLNGCVGFDTVTITVLPSAQITGNSQYNLCIGQTATLSVGGSPNYSWFPQTNLVLINDSTVSVNPNVTNSYTVIGGIGSCIDTLVIAVNVDANPVSILVSATDDSICVGEVTQLSVSGATTYSWFPSAGLSSVNGSLVGASPVGNTVYTVVGINQFCKDTATVSITVLSTPSVNVNPSTANICSGGSITLLASGNASDYSWLPALGLNTTTGSSVVATPASSVIYTVVGYNTTCSDSDFVSLNVSNAINLVSSLTDTTLCNGGSVSVSVNGASNYSWIPVTGVNSPNSGNVILSPSISVDYTVVGYNVSCSDTAFISVTINPPIDLNVTASQNLICLGDQVQLTATANASDFSWYPNNNLTGNNSATVYASPVSSQNYTVTATSGNCSETKFINIQVLAGVTVTAVANPAMVCKGSTITLVADGASSYVWLNNNQTSPSIMVSPDVSTLYTVVGLVGTCSDTAYVMAGVYPETKVTAQSNQQIAQGTQVTISASGANSYQWSPLTGIVSCENCANALVQPMQTTTYTVIGIDANGCTDTAKVTITVDENYSIFIPSAFSPNGDGENDVFYVRGRGIKELKFLIFNGWGEKVFESNSVSVGWDGKRNGKDLNSDVFIYQVSGTFYNGQTFKQKGDVTLIR